MHSKSLLAVSLSLLLFACSEPAPVANTEVPLRYVRTIDINTDVQALYRELPGVVAANKEAELSFRVSGKVVELLVKEGDEVDEGQKLARVDDTDIRIRLKSDQAAFNRAQADFNRGKALVGNGTISQADYNQLESSLAAAEAALESTKQNIIYSDLIAPFSGVIAKRNIENFEEVQAKQAIMVLQDVSAIDIKVDIPESIMILAGEDRQPEVVAIFDAIPDMTFPLTLKEIATQADRETNTYEVTMSMPTVAGYNILPGMSVTARAKHNVGENNEFIGNIFVPAHAVLEDANGRYAFVAKPANEGKALVERRNVVTGSLSSSGLEIVSGLQSDDKLIVAGMSKMYDGLTVRLTQE